MVVQGKYDCHQTHVARDTRKEHNTVLGFGCTGIDAIGKDLCELECIDERTWAHESLLRV
jgi:hypothetical protein